MTHRSLVVEVNDGIILTSIDLRIICRRIYEKDKTIYDVLGVDDSHAFGGVFCGKQYPWQQ